MHRIINAIKVATWAWKNPRTLTSANFKMLSSLYELIIKVASEGRPRLANIACIVPGEEDLQIATVWVGAGAASSPFKRIEELHEEIQALRETLADKENL